VTLVSAAIEHRFLHYSEICPDSTCERDGGINDALESRFTKDVQIDDSKVRKRPIEGNCEKVSRIQFVDRHPIVLFGIFDPRD
jgi:hypothetical protein